MLRTVLSKRPTNLNLIKPLDSSVNFQEIQRTEKHVELQHKYVISTTQTVGNSRSNALDSSTDTGKL